MKRFSDEEIVRILREAEDSSGSIRSICKKYAIAEQTFFRWRRRYGRANLSETRKLRELHDEVNKLRSLVRSQSRVLDSLKHVHRKVLTAAQRKRAVDLLIRQGLSQRTACRAVGISRSSLYYEQRSATDVE